MKSKIATIAITAVALSSPCSIAAPIALSKAFDYNAFIFNDYEGERSDVEGKLAVGGNLTVQDFDVGLLLPPDLSTSSLYVGGDLNFSRGRVNGGQTTVSGMLNANNVEFAGRVNSAGAVSIEGGTVHSGGIKSKGDVSLVRSGIKQGDIDAEGEVVIKSAGLDNGAVTYGTNLLIESGNSGTSAAVKDSANIVQVDNLDFTAIKNEVLTQSSDFANMAVNGVTTLNCGAANCLDDASAKIDTITFSGSDDINIFSIDSSWFSAADKGIVYDFSTTSINIINVLGQSVELFNTGFFNTAFKQENSYFRENGQYRDNDNNINLRHDGLYTNNILFNFVDATDVTLHSVGVKGSVLAPYAQLNFYNGHIDGNVIANSLVTPEVTLVNDRGEEYLAPTGQINNYQFGSINVSEPASIALLFGAGCFMMLRRKKH
ncbi:collagen-binding domain-containing protein [Alteromonas sp. A081]|uniref:collagen-binding domain-containing protein n=1 Tax=Alteromonas sp. A081 TaxID=3410269 RepID=UPI003B98524B